MADIFTKKKRSWVMSHIRGKHTRIERILDKELRKKDVKFKLHYGIPGQPDFVFVSEKVAVFIDGCFWHRCPMHYIAPITRKEFWKQKIGRNVKRDKYVTRKLRNDNWKVFRFWEHEVERYPDRVAGKIINYIKGRQQQV